MTRRADVDLDEILELAIELAAEAAKRHRAGGTGEVLSKSTATDPVTKVDQDSEHLIVDGIIAARPADGIVGEEGADRDSSTGVRWILDPLDGTVNYLYGDPMHAVSIGVEIDGVFSVGVVHHTTQDQTGATNDVVYAARVGGGATRNGTPISCRSADSLGTTLLAAGFGDAPEQRAVQAEVLCNVLPNVRDIRRSGSCALDLCSVASGIVDAFYETGPKIWDIAAGVVIVGEAGGTWSWDAKRNRIMAGSATIWAPLEQMLDEAEQAVGA